MTNAAIAEKLVTVRRAARRMWTVHAPGLRGMRKMQGTFTVKSDALRHAFLIAGHILDVLDAADRMKAAAKNVRQESGYIAGAMGRAKR